MRSKFKPRFVAVTVLVVATIWSAAHLNAHEGDDAAGSGAAKLELAQYGPGGAVNPLRDCQTIRSCNYRRGGLYRGCISTYTCRVCEFVTARCRIDGHKGTCRELRCTWGGRDPGTS
jgi:hypothetical protein